MKLRKSIKGKVKKPEYHPEKYTEKFIAAKMVFILLQILFFCLTFSIMFTIATKKIISSATIMLSCNSELQLSYIKLFTVSFLVIFAFIISLTIILFFLNFVFGIKLTFKEALSIVTSSYIYFTIASILGSILFLVGWGYLGYILLIVTFFLTQFNVYQTYYSVVEKHERIEGIIVAIIYVITSIITFIVLNITLFSYLKNLYLNFC